MIQSNKLRLLLTQMQMVSLYGRRVLSWLHTCKYKQSIEKIIPLYPRSVPAMLFGVLLLFVLVRLLVPVVLSIEFRNSSGGSEKLGPRPRPESADSCRECGPPRKASVRLLLTPNWFGFTTTVLLLGS